MMKQFNVTIGLILLAMLLLASHSHGQKATEIYIPIGESPGVSATASLLGTISRMDYESRSIELHSADGAKIVRITDDTLYYLDRSARGGKNEIGGAEDCTEGRKIEAYVAENGDAMWIKIEID